ncbi:hypothetical protein PSDVSF_15400 [Pseudodesulfovibrio sediminis]|uniref:Solute-binding protein family 3/N-terminal domain-containing protein n=2 Tax=Pseudodesulfovibrio sediminis TaxID=2810563 RepID=A0ABN6EPC3_9BACT|nr:hypothetical protein PSDVSF_15400 [Pseudodesulfovibrio sediminis]
MIGSAVAQSALPDCTVPFPATKKRKIIDVAAFIYPPASYISDSGEFTGETVEAMRSILRAMGFEPKFVIMPITRCLESLKLGQIPIMLPCSITEERQAYLHFSAPMYQVQSVLWKLDSSSSACWERVEDLKGKRIGVSNGYIYGPAWDKAVESRLFDVNMVANVNPEVRHFEMVQVGRTDMFICERRLGEYLKTRYAPRFDNVSACPRPVGAVRYFNAPISREYFVQRGWKAEPFLTRFNQELETLIGQKQKRSPARIVPRGVNTLPLERIYHN